MRRSTLRRCFLLFVLPPAALCLPADDVRAQEAPPGLQRVPLELVIGGIEPIIVTGLADLDLTRALVPLAVVLLHAEVPHQASGARVSVDDAPGIRSAVVDAGRRELTVGVDVAPLTPDEVLIFGGAVYLHLDRVGDLLGATATVDWGELQAVIRRELPFPREARVARTGRRETLQRIVATRHADDLPSVPLPAATGGVAFNWRLTSQSLDASRNSGAFLTAGLALLGSEVVLATAISSDDNRNTQLHFATPRIERLFPTSPWLTRISLGEVFGHGYVLRPLRGIAISNVPRTRSPIFAHVPITPQLPDGWEVEVFQGDRLVGFSDPARPGPIEVPVAYGTSPLELRMIGPAGEVNVVRYNYQVPIEQLPPGRFEYTAAFGDCPAPCATMGTLHTAWGAASWLTARTGLEVAADSAGTRFTPFGSGSITTRHGFLAHIRAYSSAQVQVQAAWYGSDRMRAQLDAELTEPLLARPTHLPELPRRWLLRPALIAGRWSGAASASGPAGEAPDSWSASASSRIAHYFVMAGVEHDPFSDVVLSGRLATPVRMPRGSSASASLAVRTAADGLEYAEGLFNALLPAAGHIGLSAWWRARSGLGVSLSFTRELGFARASTTATASEASASRIGYSLSGGANVHRGGIQFRNREGVGLGGVRGRAFVDHDGDGVFSDGDEVAAGVGVTVGLRATVTDSAGWFTISALPPYEIIAVALDTLGTTDAAYSGGGMARLTRVVPNTHTRVDVVIIRTMEVFGRLVTADGTAVGGVTLELHDLGRDTMREIRTFMDGEYYISRLQPGRYTLSIRASALDALNAEADPATLEFEILSRASAFTLDLPPISLRRRDF